MKDISNEKRQMIELLLEKSVKIGDFTLASGKKSDFFIDCKQCILTGEGHYLAGILMIAHINEFFDEVDAVAGVALGGCPMASAVSTLSYFNDDLVDDEIPALYVRKERKDHGSTQLVEGKGSVPTGSKVLLLEDVTTSGGSSLKSVEVLKADGYEVIGVLTLVDRLEGAEDAFQKAGIPFKSVLTRNDLTPPQTPRD